jgi:hypothetical protein
MKAGLCLLGYLSALLFFAACGARSAAPSGSASAPVAANAPEWARAGDQKDSGGSLFVCEGAGPDEEQAQRAALAACSAKICELCGVEVKATVETKETLTKVDITRKVVETCRRVRKTGEEIRYKQSACGPGGCTSWLQVFFSAEAAARECKAYADGNYADSGQCEKLIEQFRNTPGLDAASFRTRVALLDQAIIACAEIDVRPTPKLTAMDEILWQGVLSPSHLPWQPARDDAKQPLAGRVRVAQANRVQEFARESQSFVYHGMDRQPLLETKVFVDRLARVRDAMRAYGSIMAVLEGLAAARYSAEPNPDTSALVKAMREVIGFGEFDRRRMHTWVRNILADSKRDYPAVKDFLVQTYPPPWSWRDASVFAKLFAADDKVTDQEWSMMMQGEPCADCLGQLVGAREHGGDGKRLQRIALAVTKVAGAAKTRGQAARVLASLDADWFLRLEPKLPAEVADQIYTWDRLRALFGKLPTPGTSPSADRTRKAIGVRLGQRLERDIKSESCDRLSYKLDMLEAHGVSTRRFEADLCRCLRDAKPGRRVGSLDELYLRLVDWGAACVRKGGPS